MRCKQCDYRLWNLESRRCPECGTPFLPSDFEFIPNSVQFRCPHCLQSYYGTGTHGHLAPDEFDCVSCGQHIHMNEMLLLPTEGIREEDTDIPRMPWLERADRGRIKAWLSTIGMALVRPGRLIQLVPPRSTVRQAFWFALVTIVPAILLGGSFFIIFPVVMMARLGSFPFRVFPWLLGVGGSVIGIVAAASIGIGLWGAVTHGLLRLTGRTAGGPARTYQAICYSAGANACMGVPCLGIYVGPVWWLVSAILMVKEGQQVRGARATLAVGTLPALLLVLVVGLNVWMMYRSLSTTRSFATTTSPSSVATLQSAAADTQMVTNAMMACRLARQNRWPDHALQLVSDGYLSTSSLIASGSTTAEQSVRVGGVTLDQFQLLKPRQQRTVVQSAINSLPNGTVAHRLGDFVFTYHGIARNNPDPNLWVVVMWPDPDANGATPPTWQTRRRGNTITRTGPPGYGASVLFIGIAAIGKVDGTVSPVPMEVFKGELADQNKLRAKYKLPPIPDPAKMTHSSPAANDRD